MLKPLGFQTSRPARRRRTSNETGLDRTALITMCHNRGAAARSRRRLRDSQGGHSRAVSEAASGNVAFMGGGRGDAMRDSDDRPAERARLERAAYSRNASVADREALAAFNQQQQLVDEDAADQLAATPLGVQPSVGPSMPAPLPHLRWRGIAAAAAAGFAVAAMGSLAVFHPWAANPFDRFTVNSSEYSPASQMVTHLHYSDTESGAVLAAGPTLLTAVDRLLVFATLEYVPATESQNVCLAVIEESETGSAGFIQPDELFTHYNGGGGVALSQLNCVGREDFETRGISASAEPAFRADVDESARSAPIRITWTPSDTVVVESGPASTADARSSSAPSGR